MRGLARIEVSSPKVAVICGGMDVDRYALAEAELQISERLGLGARNSRAQAGQPQKARAELAVISVGIFDLGRIAGRPGHGFCHAALPSYNYRSRQRSNIPTDITASSARAFCG